MHRLFSLLLCLWMIALPAYADVLTIPYSFSPGTTINSSKVNANFNAGSTVVNGNLDDSNIKTAANIALTKLNLTQELPILRSAANRCFSAGVTGDTNYRLSIFSDGTIKFGAGSASAQDLMIKRSSSTQLSIRDAGDTADRDLSARALSLSTALSAANGGTGLTTPGSDGNVLTASSGAWVSSAPVSAILPQTNGGRLTLTSGTPVTITNVTAAGTIYWEPYLSDTIALWNGSAYQLVSVGSNKSLALTATSGSMYDVFGYLSGGTLALESLVWTNTTTRATAVVRDVTGVWTKSGDRTRRWLGSFYATGSNQTEDSTSRRCVFNAVNRVKRSMLAVDTTDSWVYNSATFRAFNNSATDGTGTVKCVAGIPEALLDAEAHGFALPGTSSINMFVGIGIDSTTVNSANIKNAASGTDGNFTVSAANSSCIARYQGYPVAGLHQVYPLEADSGSFTFYGDKGSANFQSGLMASMEM